MESVVYAFILIALIGGVVVGYVVGSMTCPNQGLELEFQLSELQERVAAQDIQIEGLQEEIDEAHSWMTLSIEGIEWDVPSGRIAVLAKNGGSVAVEIESVSLTLTISSVSYTDTSDDATGTIDPGDTESLVWTRTDASAPSGYPRPIEIPDEPGRYYFYVIRLNSTLGFFYETFAYPPLEEPIE